MQIDPQQRATSTELLITDPFLSPEVDAQMTVKRSKADIAAMPSRGDDNSGFILADGANKSFHQNDKMFLNKFTTVRQGSNLTHS